MKILKILWARRGEVRKATGGAVAAVLTAAGALLATGLLAGTAKSVVVGAIIVCTPLAVFLGVYRAPANQERGV